MNIGFGSMGVSPNGGASDGQPDYDYDDIKPPPKRTWLWVLIGLITIGGIAAGGYYFYQQQKELREVEALLIDAPGMSPPERAVALRRVLQSGVHDSFRMDAAAMLGDMGDPDAIPLLIDLVRDPNELSQTAAIALGRMAENGRLGEGDITRARERIFPQMEAAEGIAQTQFAFSLALLRDERCIESLLQGYIENEQARSIEGLDAHLIAHFASPQKMIDLSASDDPAVRMFAAQTLGEQRAEEGVEALIKLLGDSNRAVIRSAAESLARVSPTKAGPELIQLMQKQPALQQTLIVALRDAVGAPGLQPIYESSEDWDLRLKLIQHVRAPPAPGREQPNVPRGIGDPRAGGMCDHLYKNFPGPQPHKEMGLWCLEELGDRRAADGLFGIAQEDYSRERDNIIDDSIKSIGYLKLPGSKELLLDLLKQGKGRPATILGALGRVGDASIGNKIEAFTHCPEANVLSGGACDRETALKVLGKLQWAGARKLLMDTAERRSDDKVSTRIESRDIWQEFRLRDRVAAFEGLAHLGSPDAAELLMTTMEDTEDDPQIRLEAARALAYSVNDEVVTTILTKIADTSIDIETRKFYLAALWHRPNAEAVDTLYQILESDGTPGQLLMTAGYAIGEAGEALADQERLRRLLQHESTEYLVPICLAVLMSGDDDTMQHLLAAFNRVQGLETQVRDRYAGPDGHPVYLTTTMFEDQRIFRRLRNAQIMRDVDAGDHGWAWAHLIERLLHGTVAAPRGMSTFEVRQQLAEAARHHENPEWRRIASVTLLRMGYRGMVLEIAAGEGEGAESAQLVLRGG